MGQRVWNLHPEGGSAGLGTSPSNSIFFFPEWGMGWGIADNKAWV